MSTLTKGDNAVSKVKVGIAGCGSIAQQRHAPEYSLNSNVEIAGFYDFVEIRANELCRRYGGKVYGSFEEMILDRDIDAVSICTPNNLHAEMSVQALNAGKHVLCEKPMAANTKETREMIKAEQRSGKILMPGHNQRLVATHMEAKKLIQDDTIGKLLFFQCNFKHAGPENWGVDKTNNTWFFKKDSAKYGVLGDLGAHKIDLIRFLTGEEIFKVRANMMTLDKRYSDGNLIDLEDNVVCEFEMSNGMPGIMHFSWTNYGQEDNGSIIYGDKGVMKIFGDFDADILIEKRDGIVVKYSVGGISTNKSQLKSGVIDEFIAAIVEERKPIVTGIDGHNTMAVIEAGVISNRKGT